MTNQEIAAMLFNIATLLRDRQDNPYRIRAYEQGARALMGRNDNVVETLSNDDATFVHRKGVLGERLQRRLKELVRTGHMSYFDELCADLPPYMGALMQVPGIGPRTAENIHQALHIETPAQLVQAARQGRLQQVWGFGPKRQAQIAQMSQFDEQPSLFAEYDRMAA